MGRGGEQKAQKVESQLSEDFSLSSLAQALVEWVTQGLGRRVFSLLQHVASTGQSHFVALPSPTGCLLLPSQDLSPQSLC